MNSKKDLCAFLLLFGPIYAHYTILNKLDLYIFVQEALTRDGNSKALFLHTLDLEMLLLDLGKVEDAFKSIERVFKLVASSSLSENVKKVC